jgi:hypothetical protein
MDPKHLLETYGNPDANHDGVLDLDWAHNCLKVFPLPFPMHLSWDVTTVITRFQAHVLAGDRIISALAAMRDANGVDYLQVHKLDYWGGCFNFRPMREGTALSMHSWGVAVDINPQIGRFHNLDDKVSYPQFIVDAFEKSGFEWGGHWAAANVDPMHFQLIQ